MLLYKKIILFATSFIFTQTFFAQELSMPSFPIINSMPQMPVLQTPSIGTSFYTPGTKTLSQEKTIQNNQEQNNFQKIKESIATSKILPQNNITAADLQTLDSMGLFSGIYNLTNNSLTNENNNNFLGNVLNELSTLKNNNLQNTQNNNLNISNKYNSKILRFIINGKNILDTCSTIYFSNKEKDGTFLVTGDRKFLQNDQTRTETFYLLFTPTNKSGINREYKVIPSLVQDKTNESSFLYNFTTQKEITASKTGNLVSLKSNQNNYNFDLLLDIGE